MFMVRSTDGTTSLDVDGDGIPGARIVSHHAGLQRQLYAGPRLRAGPGRGVAVWLGPPGADRCGKTQKEQLISF